MRPERKRATTGFILSKNSGDIQLDYPRFLYFRDFFLSEFRYLIYLRSAKAARRFTYFHILLKMNFKIQMRQKNRIGQEACKIKTRFNENFFEDFESF